jgi:hypothetical protein
VIDGGELMKYGCNFLVYELTGEKENKKTI